MRSQTKSTGWKKIYCADTNQKTAGVTVLDKVVITLLCKYYKECYHGYGVWFCDENVVSSSRRLKIINVHLITTSKFMKQKVIKVKERTHQYSWRSQ